MKKMKVLLYIFLFASLVFPFSITGAQSTNHAGLVIKYGDGSIQTFCVSFPGDSITGYELLQETGLDLKVNIFGSDVAVCSIRGTGCPGDDTCLICQMPSYWVYWHLREKTWEYSSLGAGDHKLHDKDVDGWVWGNGQSSPPPISYEEICKSHSSDQKKPAKTRKPTFIPATPAPPTPSPTKQPTNTATPLPSQIGPPTSSPIPAIPAASVPTAAIITDTSPPAFAENVETTPSSTAEIVESFTAPESGNNTEEISGPPRKAVDAAAKAGDFYSLEATDVPEKNVSAGSPILDFLKIIQNFLTSLLP